MSASVASDLIDLVAQRLVALEWRETRVKSFWATIAGRFLDIKSGDRI